jgi:CBS domain-containing protein
MLVRDVMRTNVPEVEADRSLEDAVSLMLDADSEYCVVTVGGEPGGLVTERRAVLAVYKYDRPLEELPASVFATGFDETITPGRTLLYAVGRMRKRETHVLPVVENLHLNGLLTERDVVRSVERLRAELSKQATDRTKW